MMKSIIRSLIAMAAIVGLSCVDATALSGSWRGSLSLGEMKLPLVFNFAQDGNGLTTCTLDSPSQGAKGIPTKVLVCTADSISLECSVIGATFNGTVSRDTITGTLRQRGYSFPMVLTPDSPMEERRPQTPKPPYPYTVKDTVFVAPDGIALSATLTLPAMDRQQTVPGVVMISGSGPQNRDEELFDHRPFAVIADFLARNGVASLRYDDRGTGESKGDFLKGTTYTFRDDARGGVDFMRSIPSVGSVGVLGHSEGGTIAFMLGAEEVPDFIISLAGLAVTGKEALLAQNARLLGKSGVSGRDRENSLELIGHLFDEFIKQRENGTVTPVDPDSLAKAYGLQVPREVLASLQFTQKVRTPWFDTLLGIDPGESISRIKCPVLALNGDKDTQVEAAPNLAVIRRLCPEARIRMMASLNHMMQHAQTGDMTEYNDIRETISPEVLDIILEFVRKHSLPND